MTAWSLELAYEQYPELEQQFEAALDRSLAPRGPGVLFELVDELSLPEGSAALDMGCGEGRYSIELARRFGFQVTGIDPVARHLRVAKETLAAAAAETPDLAGRVRFQAGAAGALPLPDYSVDVVWCRDVLVHVADLTGAFREFKRILRQDGRAVTYQMLGTERLEPTETAWLWTVMGVVPASADRQRVEAAVTAAGLRIIESIDLSTEWGEWGQEHNGSVGRKLLHAARLLRDPERYRSQFGAPAYDMMLGDCLWHVYAMIGKLTRRAYVLGP